MKKIVLFCFVLLNSFIAIAQENENKYQMGEIHGNFQMDAQNYYEEGTIIRVNDRDSIEFTFAGNCTVQVKLSEQNDQTLIELTQSEIPLDDNSKRNIRLGCAFGWTFYLINLKSVLEGGLDLRNKNSDLVDLVNN